MQEQDNFYKTLPFTLTQDQSKPTYIILGTGLQQCLIAAHISKTTQQPGLILDTDKTYGSCLKTLTFKELHALTTQQEKQKLYTFYKPSQYTQKNQKFYDWVIENKAHRGYNIDVQPNYFFANSTTCDLLREADMDKYMDFRLVSSMLHFDSKSKSLKNVPLSKGKIFESKDLGLMEKRLLLNSFHTLAKIYHKFDGISQDQNSTKQFDKDFGQVDEATYSQFLENLQQMFIPFVSKLTKNNKKIMQFIIYIICNYQYNYNKVQNLPQHIKKQYKLKSFIKRFGKFLTSCGVYGQGPYLYVDNGIGDVPQSYSRIASIYGATYILHPKIKIQKIQCDKQNKQIKLWSNLYPQGYLTTKTIYYGPTFYEQKYSDVSSFDRQFSFRLIVLSNQMTKQQNQQQKQIKQQHQSPSIVYLLDLENIDNPVYMFQFDSASHTCPRGFMMHQFETVIDMDKVTNNEEAMQKIVDELTKNLINILIGIKGQNFQKMIKYVSPYIRQKRYPKNQKILQTKVQSQGQVQRELQYILKDHNGIDLDSHFINFKQVMGNKKLYFKREQDQKKKEQENQGIDDQTADLVDRLENVTKMINQEVKVQVRQNQKQDQVKQTETIKQKHETQKQQSNQQQQNERNNKQNQTQLTTLENNLQEKAAQNKSKQKNQPNGESQVEQRNQNQN